MTFKIFSITLSCTFCTSTYQTLLSTPLSDSVMAEYSTQLSTQLDFTTRLLHERDLVRHNKKTDGIKWKVKKNFIFSFFWILQKMSGIYNKNPSLSVAKKALFQDVHWWCTVVAKGYCLRRLAGSASLNTRSGSKTSAPISDLNTK